MGSILVYGFMALGIGFVFLGFVKGLGLAIMAAVVAGWWHTRK